MTRGVALVGDGGMLDRIDSLLLAGIASYVIRAFGAA
jgi:CDP-diglyceride synthetase